MSSPTQDIPAYLDKVVHFADGRSFEILRPLTDFRKCHDGTPLEARIVFTCKEVGSEMAEQQGDHEFVMKVKVQAPDSSDDGEQKLAEGPSTTTAAELKALETFTKADMVCTPHLVAFKNDVQGANGMLPGGYLTFMVMTKMPGQDLLALRFWNQTNDWREEIVQEFSKALRSTYESGIEPLDCALRNVLWEPETKKCSIIDFELWREASETFSDEKKELERWGLARRKTPISWWAAWKMQEM